MSILLWMSEDDKEAKRQLSYLRQIRGFTFKSLGDITSGYVDDEIRKLVDEANLILLPLSAEFLANKDCAVGLDLAIDRHRRGETLAVNVVVKECAWWSDERLKDLQFLPADRRALEPVLEPARWEHLAIGLDSMLSFLDLRPQRGGAAYSSRPFRSREKKMVSEEQRSITPSASTPALKEGLMFADRYRLIARVGINAVATLWRAIDHQDGRLVALHVLHPTQDRLRVFGYLAILASLRHEALIPIVETGTVHRGCSFYVTEFFEGTTLKREALKRRVSIGEVISLVQHLGGALATAHRRGIPHGDVRPANILIDDHEAPRLANFQVDWSASSIQPLHPGAFEAHLYAAPELYESGACPNAKSDIYSLCLTALFCLRGSELPDEVSGLASSHVAEEALFMVIEDLNCPSSIADILKRACARDPIARFDDVDTFRAALLAAHGQEGEAACELINLPTGSFSMGSETSPFKHDKPAHKVNLSAFSMGKYQVTQELYQEVMLSNPSYVRGQRLPVNRVTFLDAVTFCNRLSALEGLDPAYTINGESIVWHRDKNGYRLPTEAEWEYAARGAGEEGRAYPWGSTPEPGMQLCWSGPGNDLAARGHRGPSPVGSYEAGQTPEGLMDMAGNVWEWCWDWYAPYASAEEVSDPEGPPGPPSDIDRPPLRCLRGAAWSSKDPKWILTTARGKEVPSARDPDIGFRIARSLLTHSLK